MGESFRFVFEVYLNGIENFLKKKDDVWLSGVN